jgi:hypothetical protein
VWGGAAESAIAERQYQDAIHDSLGVPSMQNAMYVTTAAPIGAMSYTAQNLGLH